MQLMHNEGVFLLQQSKSKVDKTEVWLIFQKDPSSLLLLFLFDSVCQDGHTHTIIFIQDMRL